MRTCERCGKPLPKGRRKWCSSPCERGFRDNQEYADMIMRMIRALGRRAAGDTELLPIMRDLAGLIESQMGDAVESLRREDVTWAEIAEQLGTTRQAAQMRYRRKVSSQP